MLEPPTDKAAADRWRLIEQVFDEAIEIPRTERAAWLERKCSVPAIRDEVQAMLLAHDRQDGILEVPIADIATSISASASSPELIGPYRVLRTLGQGGMGTVYLAIRDDGQFSNRVALKVLNEGVHFEELEHRFHTERRILATLQTDCIARILDGGVTDDGRPYFAMEFVEGSPIDEYCARNGASIRRRVDLLASVADAVHIAHAGLVVHRDLKPSNILVTADGAVKLLDFGVAKMIAGDETRGDTSLTQTGARWMTPEYAAPEQILGTRITTATDVYQLGVVAYELLAGQKPFTGTGQSSFSLQKSICETDALKPSDAAAKAQPKGMLLPSERSRALRGDLDAIILKAIRKNPAERYASAEAFADDLRRFLGSRPVRARRNSRIYRSRKFVRRNIYGVLTAFAVFVAAVGYVVSMRVQQDRIGQERERAEKFSTLLIDLFASPDPFNPLDPEVGKDITVYEFLESAGKRVRDDLDVDPAMRRQLLGSLATVHANLGNAVAAESLLVQVLRQMPTEDVENRVGLYQTLTDVLIAQDRRHEADSVFRVVLDESKVASDQSYDAARVSYASYLVRISDIAGADSVMSLVEPSISGRQRAEPIAYSDALAVLGRIRHLQFRLKEADSIYTVALRARESTLGARHPHTARVLLRLAVIGMEMEEYDRAGELFDRALTIFGSSVGDESLLSTATLNDMALMAARLEDYSVAEDLQRAVVRRHELSFGSRHSEVAMAKQNLATYLMRQDKLDEAEVLFDEVLPLTRATMGPDHYLVAFPYLSKWELAIRRGQLREAVQATIDAEHQLRKTYDKDHPFLAVTASRRGRALALMGRNEEAEALLRYGSEVLSGTEGWTDQKAKTQVWLNELIESRTTAH